MSAVWTVARRSLMASPLRLVVSVGGVALALSLMLALDAIVAGVSRQLTSYIDGAGADVWVAQAGVRNLHMVSSWLPATVGGEVQATEGVAAVTPILYVTDTIAANGQRAVVYVFGLPASATMGIPQQIAQGTRIPGPGEAVIGQDFARQAGVGIGDRVTILGRDLRIAGIAASGGNLLNGIAFVATDDFRAARGGFPVVSFVLVRTAPGASPDAVAAAIEQRVPGVTALSRTAFAAEERRLVMQMAGDVITVMNGVGAAVGLAVVVLTVYVAVLARRREYGILKALGASARTLYAIVLVQAFLSVLFAFAAALMFTATLGAVVHAARLPLTLQIEAGSLLSVALVGVAIAAAASVLPIRQIAAVDPAVVFRRGPSL